MIETIAVFLGGVVFGALVVVAIKEVWDWIDGLTTRVNTLRNELSFYRMQREQWYEFQDWVRMNKKEKQ